MARGQASERSVPKENTQMMHMEPERFVELTHEGKGS